MKLIAQHVLFVCQNWRERWNYLGSKRNGGNSPAQGAEIRAAAEVFFSIFTPCVHHSFISSEFLYGSD
jgi:hypothetical protein